MFRQGKVPIVEGYVEGRSMEPIREQTENSRKPKIGPSMTTTSVENSNRLRELLRETQKENPEKGFPGAPASALRE